MRDHLVAYFSENQKIVEADALRLLLTSAHPLLSSRRVVEALGSSTPIVTRELVERVLALETLPPIEAPKASRSPPPFELLREGFEPVNGAKPIEAFEGLFRSRFSLLQRLLKGRSELPDLRPIAELRRSEGAVSVVGMVRDARETSEKHHLIVGIEDPSGAVELLVPRDSPAARGTFLPDEVVGLRVRLPRERGRIPIVESVVRPDVPAARGENRPEGARRVLFLSDLHIGSRSFLDGPWEGLVRFLRGRSSHPEMAHEIHYVVVAGDLVDGIGIYPGQERDLAIPDIVEQYKELGRRLGELPDRLTVVVLPGNHDAVCPAEPQPSLPEELAELLPRNVRSVGNPSTFALDGVVVQGYHGRSFDDLIPALPGASYARPTEVMKRMLQMRHLAPSYGGRTPIAPLPRDGLVIDPAPDILVTGHAHTFGVDRYRGVLLLNASTWQAETDYQRMRNISPVPAQAAVADLRDSSLARLDFSTGDLPEVAG